MRLLTGSAAIAIVLCSLNAASARTAFKGQEARDWSVACRDNGYCIARTSGKSKSGELVTLKLERSDKEKSKIYITIRPKSPDLKVGMDVELAIAGHEFSLRGPVKKVYRGNEMTFPVNFDNKAIDKLRVGRFAQIKIKFGGKTGTRVYDLSIQGASSALAMMDIAQGRLDREDAAVIRGGEYYGAVSHHDFREVHAPPKPEGDEKSSLTLDPEHNLSEDDGPSASEPALLPDEANEDSGLGETVIEYSENKIDAKVMSFGYRTLGCALPETVTAFGAQVINLEPGVFLYLVPCQMADANIPYYAVMETAGRFELIEFQHSSAEEGAQPALMINAGWDKKTGTLTGHQYYSPNRDCGSFERHRLSLQEQTFYLKEFRQKEKCDGRQQKPETYPVSWSGEGD